MSGEWLQEIWRYRRDTKLRYRQTLQIPDSLVRLHKNICASNR